MSVNDNLYEVLEATTEGDRGREAALWLLRTHRRWWRPLTAHAWISHNLATEHRPHDLWAEVEWEAIGELLANPPREADANEKVLLVGTGSEATVLAACCWLATGYWPAPIDHPNDRLSGLDDRNRRLVLHAIAWAMGGRSYADSILPIPDKETRR